MYRKILLQASLKLIRIWWPSLLFISVALVYLYFEERRDKHKKRPFRRQSEKVN